MLKSFLSSISQMNNREKMSRQSDTFSDLEDVNTMLGNYRNGEFLNNTLADAEEVRIMRLVLC